MSRAIITNLILYIYLYISGFCLSFRSRIPTLPASPPSNYPWIFWSLNKFFLLRLLFQLYFTHLCVCVCVREVCFYLVFSSTHYSYTSPPLFLVLPSLQEMFKMQKKKPDDQPPPPPLPIFWIENSDSVSRHFQFEPDGQLSVSPYFQFNCLHFHCQAFLQTVAVPIYVLGFVELQFVPPRWLIRLMVMTCFVIHFCGLEFIATFSTGANRVWVKNRKILIIRFRGEVAITVADGSFLAAILDSF